MSGDKNLTGEQIQQIMDMCLYKALEPIILYTNAFDAQAEYLLMLIAANGKRKLSSLDREVVVESLAAYVAHPDRRKKYELIREARIERYFLHGFVKKFVTDNLEFVRSYNEYIESPSAVARNYLNNRAAIIGNCGRADFFNAIRVAHAYINRFYSYRETVIGHYLKHSSKQAKAYVSQSHGNTDFRDLRQSILKAVITALDKYDSRKGALTSYINFWIFNAATGSTEHEYGIAYTIPQTQKKKLFEKQSSEVNFSVSLDALSKNDDDENTLALHSTLGSDNQLDEDIENMETSRIVQALAKCVDRRGVARLCLDIGEYFSPGEMQQMREQMLSEGLA